MSKGRPLSLERTVPQTLSYHLSSRVSIVIIIMLALTVIVGGGYAAWPAISQELVVQVTVTPVPTESGQSAPQDSDGDGVSDMCEEALGTDPNSSDSDEDGVQDAEEVRDGTDPNKADTEGDGVSDGEEKKDGTDPLDAEDPAPEPEPQASAPRTVSTTCSNPSTDEGSVAPSTSCRAG